MCFRLNSIQLTFFNNQTTFLALKQLNDVYYDRSLYYGRLMPCAKQWFFNRLAVRAGEEVMPLEAPPPGALPGRAGLNRACGRSLRPSVNAIPPS